jgi:hypothetical protein
MHNVGVVLSINFTAHGHVNNQCTTIVNWNAVFTELALFFANPNFQKVAARL